MSANFMLWEQNNCRIKTEKSDFHFFDYTTLQGLD